LELPPAIPPAYQVIAGLLRPLTFAVNCTALPATTEGAFGEIVIVAARSELAEVRKKANRISIEMGNLRIIGSSTRLMFGPAMSESCPEL
jgi:hypothetical protein